MTDPREWLVIEDSRKNAVFAPAEAKQPKGYIPRAVAEKLLGRDLGGAVWFTREDSEKMRAHPDWREDEPPGTDTQADLTERARPVAVEFFKHWISASSNPSDHIDAFAAALAAFAQSEHEAAAAEARTVIEAARDLLRYAKIENRASDRVFVSRERMHQLDAALRALASPPAPQEETR